MRTHFVTNYAGNLPSYLVPGPSVGDSHLWSTCADPVSCDDRSTPNRGFHGTLWGYYCDTIVGRAGSDDLAWGRSGELGMIGV